MDNELSKLMYQTLDISKDLVNLVMEYISEHVYYKEQEISLYWENVSDMKTHNNNVCVLGYINKKYCLDQILIRSDDSNRFTISHNYRYFRSPIEMIEWREKKEYIYSNSIIRVIEKHDFSYHQSFQYIKNCGEIKKFMITKNYIIVHGKNHKILRINIENHNIIKILKNKKQKDKFLNYDFYFYNEKIYLLSMVTKKILVYDAFMLSLDRIKTISIYNISFESKKIRIIINDDIIYVNDGKKLLILDMDGRYVSNINYNNQTHVNLPFCVNDGKIYLSTKRKILVYNQKRKYKRINYPSI
jgi:hypothetical protein